MDLLDSDNETGSSDSVASDLENVGVGHLEDREAIDVGCRVELRGFSGRCIGDDVSWKGPNATRFASLQAGGTGGDRYVWGEFWAAGMRELGADVALVAETCLWGEAATAQAIKGMDCQGYHAIAHGVGPPRGSSEGVVGASANGVVLAVKKTYAGNWEHIARDRDGRGIAGNIVGTCGATIRVVGLYGVSGASLPGFCRDSDRTAAERRLSEFIKRQRDLAEEQGWLMVVVGDVNSVRAPNLDTWKGTHIERDDCLASFLTELGLVDTFRHRHPEAKAFTYFGHTKGASRLDGVWALSAMHRQLTVLNAAILWGWKRRTDHEPALMNALFKLPTLPTAAQVQPAIPWRQLIGRMLGSEREALAAQVQNAVAQRRTRFDELETVGRELQLECDPTRLFVSECEGIEGFPLEGALGDGRTPELRQRVSSHYCMATCRPC